MIDKNRLNTQNRKIEVRLQNESKSYFNNITTSDEYFDISVCNPPFFSDIENEQYKTEYRTSHMNQQEGQCEGNET